MIFLSELGPLDFGTEMALNGLETNEARTQ
jgi:hypothetical protein